MILPLLFWFDNPKGPNGRNSPGIVWINRRAKHKTAVYGQEVYESLHKLHPVNLFHRLTSDDARREMEFMGHEIEVQLKRIHYDLHESLTRMSEAISMRRGYDGLFNMYTKEEVYDKLLYSKEDALDWISDYRKDIEKFHRKHGKK